MRRVLLVAVLAVVVAACGDSGTDDETPGELSTAAPQEGNVVTIEIKDFAFNPPDLVVPEGTRLVWTNADGVAHTVTGDEGPWSGMTSGEMPPGLDYTFDMGAPDSFTYFCSIHPQMTGTIEVTG